MYSSLYVFPELVSIFNITLTKKLWMLAFWNMFI